MGSRFTVITVDSDALDAVNDQLANYRGPRQSTTLTVTGIGQIARDINPTTVLEDQAHVYVTPAFLNARPASLVNAGTAVRLRPGEDVGAFQSAVEQLARSHGIDQSAVYFTAERDHTRAVARSVRPEALGLALLGLVVGLAALLVLGQALSRQAFVDASESPLLGSIGMTRRQRFGLGLARVGAVSVIGSIGAVLIAIALSPLFPIGPARATEPSPGFGDRRTRPRIGARRHGHLVRNPGIDPGVERRGAGLAAERRSRRAANSRRDWPPCWLDSEGGRNP